MQDRLAYHYSTGVVELWPASSSHHLLDVDVTVLAVTGANPSPG